MPESAAGPTGPSDKGREHDFGRAAGGGKRHVEHAGVRLFAVGHDGPVDLFEPDVGGGKVGDLGQNIDARLDDGEVDVAVLLHADVVFREVFGGAGGLGLEGVVAHDVEHGGLSALDEVADHVPTDVV